MTANFPGPYELRVFYSCGSATQPALQHVLRINMACETEPDIGALYSAIDIVRENDIPTTLAAVTNDLVEDLVPFFNDTYATIDYTEFWKYAPGTFDAEWVATRTEEEPGTSVQVMVPGGQLIFTFRTAEGGIVKCNLMETVIPVAETQRPAVWSAGENALANNYNGGDQNAFLGRDTSYVRANLGLYKGVNERLFKRRYRP